jgi:methionyl-tRNA formyltransferase
LLAGEAETGVSIMELVRKMDAGPVISRLAIPIAADDTAATLEPRMATAGAEELVRVLPGWLAGTLQARAQDEDQATYCHLVTKQDGHLRAGWPVSQAERAVRAYNPWPGAFVLFKGDRLGIWKAHVTAGESAVAGTMATIERLPAIAFEGGWLVLDEVQKPGGKRISAQQFLAGERGELPPTVGLA